MWTMGVVKRPLTPSAASPDETASTGGAAFMDEPAFTDEAGFMGGAAFAGRAASADGAGFMGGADRREIGRASCRERV